jgi:hypothetical protein
MTRAAGWERFVEQLRRDWRPGTHPLAAHPERLFEPLRWVPDPWQLAVLRSNVRQTLILCARQMGKSLCAAAKALLKALTKPGSLSVIISRSQDQAAEVLLKVTVLHRAWLGELRGRALERAVSNWGLRHLAAPDPDELGYEVDTVRDNVLSKCFDNGSRIETFACKGETAVGTTTDLLILDEAARMPDPVYLSVRPTLAIAQSAGRGELLALSTPFGRRGWFWEAHRQCDEAERQGKRLPWHRVSIGVEECPRISAEFLEEEKAAMGAFWYGQEYELKWLDAADAVFRGEDVERTLAQVSGRLFEEV